MQQKKTISISKNGLSAFEREVDLAVNRKNRTLKDVTNKDVVKILANPGAAIEIIDSRNRVISTIAAGVGASGLATAATCIATVAAGGIATASTVATGAAMAGKSMALAGGGSVMAAGLKGAAVSAAVPGPGWIIAGGILVATAVTTTIIAVNANADKNSAQRCGNEMLIHYQKAIQKLTEEIRLLKKERKEASERYNYIVALLKTLNPGNAPA